MPGVAVTGGAITEMALAGAVVCGGVIVVRLFAMGGVTLVGDR